MIDTDLQCITVRMPVGAATDTNGYPLVRFEPGESFVPSGVPRLRCVKGRPFVVPADTFTFALYILGCESSPTAQSWRTIYVNTKVITTLWERMSVPLVVAGAATSLMASDRGAGASGFDYQIVSPHPDPTMEVIVDLFGHRFVEVEP